MSQVEVVVSILLIMTILKADRATPQKSWLTIGSKGVLKKCSMAISYNMYMSEASALALATPTAVTAAALISQRSSSVFLYISSIICRKI